MGTHRNTESQTELSRLTIDISKKLLDRTGKGTSSLLYDSLKENKYGPTIEGQDQPISEPKKSKDSNQPPQKTGYLSFGEFQRVKDEQAQSISQQEVIDALSSSNTVTDKLGTRPISTPEFRTNLNRRSADNAPVKRSA